MAYEILIIIAGLVVGWVRKGSVWSMTNLRMKHLWVLPVAYLLQHFSIDNMHGIAYQVSIIMSYLGLILFCLLNVRVSGLSWALAGTLANFLVMAANGLRMPAYLAVIRRVDPRLVPLLEAGKYGKSVAMGPNTHLNFLGDIFPFRLWPQSMISVGDILFGIGLIILIQYAMTATRGESLDDKQVDKRSVAPR